MPCAPRPACHGQHATAMPRPSGIWSWPSMPRPSWSRPLAGLPTRSWLPAHGARGDAFAALFQLMPLGVGGLAQRSPSSGQTARARATAHRWRRPDAQKRTPLMPSTCGVATVSHLAPPAARGAAHCHACSSRAGRLHLFSSPQRPKAPIGEFGVLLLRNSLKPQGNCRSLVI